MHRFHARSVSRSSAWRSCLNRVSSFLLIRRDFVLSWGRVPSGRNNILARHVLVPTISVLSLRPIRPACHWTYTATQKGPYSCWVPLSRQGLAVETAGWSFSVISCIKRQGKWCWGRPSRFRNWPWLRPTLYLSSVPFHHRWRTPRDLLPVRTGLRRAWRHSSSLRGWIWVVLVPSSVWKVPIGSSVGHCVCGRWWVLAVWWSSPDWQTYCRRCLSPNRRTIRWRSCGRIVGSSVWRLVAWPLACGSSGDWWLSWRCRRHRGLRAGSGNSLDFHSHGPRLSSMLPSVVRRLMWWHTSTNSLATVQERMLLWFPAWSLYSSTPILPKNCHYSSIVRWLSGWTRLLLWPSLAIASCWWRGRSMPRVLVVAWVRRCSSWWSWRDRGTWICSCCLDGIVREGAARCPARPWLISGSFGTAWVGLWSEWGFWAVLGLM